MKNFYLKSAIFLLLIISTTFNQKLLAGNPERNATGRLISISGYVKDTKTGEVLTGATVYIKEVKKATSTNQYGFYSISLST